MSQYILEQRMQPVVIGIDGKGELIWSNTPMAKWQQAMFPRQYIGDFSVQWMSLTMKQKYDWEMD